MDNKQDLIAQIEKQPNFSEYVQKLIEQDIARLNQALQPLNAQPKIVLTDIEARIYSHCLKYFREIGVMNFGKYCHYFPIQTDPDLLRCLLLDVQDIISKYSNTTAEYIKQIRENDADYQTFYNKLNDYWQQENPIPDDWKKEIIPGLTLIEALSKIIPEALKLKEDNLQITIRRISDLTGLTYQQAYTQLMPSIKPILKELNIDS